MNKGQQTDLTKPNASPSNTPLQYSCLENPVDREGWCAAVMGSQGVRHDSATELNISFSFHALMLFVL